jgi:hypothetical protein
MWDDRRVSTLETSVSLEMIFPDASKFSIKQHVRGIQSHEPGS